MLPTSGKVYLEWDNRKRVELGSVRIESDRKGTEFTVKTRFRRARCGWEFVKFGMRQILFGGRKSKDERTETDCTEHGVAAG